MRVYYYTVDFGHCTAFNYATDDRFNNQLSSNCG